MNQAQHHVLLDVFQYLNLLRLKKLRVHLQEKEKRGSHGFGCIFMR
ncbi:Uncharacterized protein APZ42_012586 [Daphnia magna]|uniref:Uncharacterized protein n=1 Tax=Daphnia magna TaxID=35525 RepID=A0A162RMU7_9CRUS|nr:Uncharacterized protein APZ42_012586 [Daphnia magna]